jgi:signal transduction histidine kinase
MTITILVLTVAVIAIVSTKLTHREMKRLTIEENVSRSRPVSQLLARSYEAAGGWRDARATLERVAEITGKNAVLVDATQKVMAVAPPMPDARLTVESDGALTIYRQGARAAMRMKLLAPQADIRDSAGRVVGHLYLFQREPAEPQPGSNFDRLLLLTFIAAGALGVLMALAIARRITGPIERLTEATRRLESGDLTARVDANAGDEIGELARAFNAMASSIARNEELRSRMVADVAHELRTPLTNLRCQLESIDDGLVEPTPEVLRSIGEDATLLERLVTDLQDLALAEAGKLRLNVERVSLRAVVERAAASVAHTASANGVTVSAPIDGALEVNADPLRLQQILTNILTNAITHTSSGGTATVNASEAADTLTISVRDTGSGIAPSELPNIFERFYRADSSRGRTTGGAGLGLAIVKELVAAHGGRVWVESELGRGTTVYVALPC